MHLFNFSHGAKKAAAPNNGFGLFGGGRGNTGYSNYTDKYTYANDSIAAGTILGLARFYLAACSSSPGGF